MPRYTSFNFADMEDEIRRYISDVVASSQSDGSTIKDTVYRSLEPFLTDFIDYWRDFALQHAISTPSLSKWDVPLSSSFMDFPDEIKMHIINTIPHADLLALRVVNKRLWELITPITHSRLHFRMPPGWAAFMDSSVTPHKWASGAELLGAIFISEAWFLPNVAVTRVAITGYCHSEYFIPLMPFPFMLPSTVRDLKLARFSLMCHSLLGLLSPGTQLDSLEIDRVDDGFVITPSSPSADEIDIWRELNGFHSFCQQVVKSPPPASLRQLKINFSPFVPQGTAHVGHQRDLEFYDMRGSHAHLPLSGLHVLEHVKLVAPVCSIRCMLWSVISWTASAKELTTATLDIVAVLLNNETDHLSQLCDSLAADTSVKAIFMSTRMEQFQTDDTGAAHSIDSLSISSCYDYDPVTHDKLQRSYAKPTLPDDPDERNPAVFSCPQRISIEVKMTTEPILGAETYN
ncbi:hypothetical protein EDD18DRAFT_1114247 [Armillaria luteobubalina]|uniref:F-box domain-containing protein n=1 Tax=Armillaria luteobubalina TaxID=153913 RepID=A0AA39P5P9_9AGAR|nr:hypothetical protein EDD18DRAFT_1114247 [Armillaria luteobubalina]